MLSMFKFSSFVLILLCQMMFNNEWVKILKKKKTNKKTYFLLHKLRASEYDAFN